MADYTITITTAQDEVLAWEAGRQPKPTTPGELVQQIMDRVLNERAGHFREPRERLSRLTPAEKALIPPAIRDKLGLS